MAAMNSSNVTNYTNDDEAEEYTYMRLALKVARAALAVGEVPVGCVIVLDTDKGRVVVSHGANQVNATRDATRHAEIVAIDRMLSAGMASDQLRLPPETIAKAVHGGVVPAPPLFHFDDDKWKNVPENANHWKNDFGWGSGKIFKQDIFQKCDLYVTCEPCIMVSSQTHTLLYRPTN
jgi:tRNA-specific adenosine deaminase 2